MKKIDLGQTVAILANVGVIAGIVFLGYELRQNNELMAAEQRFNRLIIATGTPTMVAENPDLAQAYVKANNDPDSLNAVERVQLNAVFWRVFQNMQWTFFELPREELPIEEWRSNPRNIGHWCVGWAARKNHLDQEFVRFMEEDVGIRC